MKNSEGPSNIFLMATSKGWYCVKFQMVTFISLTSSDVFLTKRIAFEGCLIDYHIAHNITYSAKLPIKMNHL